MAQWGNIDRKQDSPIWAPAQVGKASTRLEANNLFNNTTADAYITGATVGSYGVSVAEMNDAVVGQVASVTVSTAGSGYTARPVVTFSGGGAGVTAATAQATSKVVSATIYAAGADYANGDVVQIDTTGFTGATTGAKFNVTTNATGNVTALTINTAGAFLNLTGNIANNQTSNVTGIGTGLVLNLSFGVLAVTMLTNGTGYTSTPTVTLLGNNGSGTGTVAVAALASEQSGVTSAGWVLRKTVGSRTQYETLVAMKSISSDASDDSQLPE